MMSQALDDEQIEAICSGAGRARVNPCSDVPMINEGSLSDSYA